MIRKKIKITISIDEVVLRKANKNRKATSIDDYINHLLEQRAKFIEIQRENAVKTHNWKKGITDDVIAKRKNKAPVYLGNKK